MTIVLLYPGNDRSPVISSADYRPAVLRPHSRWDPIPDPEVTNEQVVVDERRTVELHGGTTDEGCTW